MQALKPLLKSQGAWRVLRRCAHQTTAHGSNSTLKEELRRLFKLVHPDMLHNLPAEQAINLRSFQLLQEYLNVAKGADGSSHHFTYNFEFYVRRNGNAGDDSLEKVEISLPAPKVRVHPQRGPELLPETRAEVGRLLSACGLSSEVSGGLTGGEEKWNLASFFQQASEIQRQNETAVLNIEQQLVVVRNALRIGRGVTASFRTPVAEASARRQLEALEKLSAALDRAKGIALTGCTILIGDCYGVDALGNLWLNHEDDKECWSKFVQQVDLITASDRRSAARARRLKEFELAHLMEVEMVFTHSSLAVHPDYSSFLGRMVEEAMTQGAVGEGKFCELPVRISSPHKLDDAPFAVDKAMGYICVPVWERLDNIYKFIEEKGLEALGHRRRFKDAEKGLEELQAQVRKTLRLRNLMFDVTTSNDQNMAACKRLLYHSPHLLKYTENLCLSISDETRLPSKGVKGFANLKWNFNMADL